MTVRAVLSLRHRIRNRRDALWVEKERLKTRLKRRSVLAISFKVFLLPFFVWQLFNVIHHYFLFETTARFNYDLNLKVTIPTLGFCFDYRDFLNSVELTENDYHQLFMATDSKFNFTLKRLLEDATENVIDGCFIRDWKTRFKWFEYKNGSSCLTLPGPGVRKLTQGHRREQALIKKMQRGSEWPESSRARGSKKQLLAVNLFIKKCRTNYQPSILTTSPMSPVTMNSLMKSSSKTGSSKKMDVPKKSKAVILLSSYHDSPVVVEYKNKPEMVMDYNKKKIGVDIFDAKAKLYSTRRATKRWTLALFFHVLDAALINSYILYCEKFNLNSKKYPRKLYMRDLSLELALDHAKHRVQDKHIDIKYREIIAVLVADAEKVSNSSENISSSTSFTPSLTSSQSTIPSSPQPSTSQVLSPSSSEVSSIPPVPVQFSNSPGKRCAVCPSNKRKQTAIKCSICNKRLCKEHRQIVCSGLNCRGSDQQ